MKSIFSFLTCLIIAVWLVAVAIVSVQNATPVTLTFLTWQSIPVPVGVLLGFSAALGLLGGSLAQLLWREPAVDASSRRPRAPRYQEESDKNW